MILISLHGFEWMALPFPHKGTGSIKSTERLDNQLVLCPSIVTIICPYLGDIEDPTMVKRSQAYVYWCTKAVNKGKQHEKHICGW